MIRNLLFFSLIVSSQSSFGQFDSLLHEQLNHTYTTSEMILHSRRLILDKFSDGDFKEVRKLKDYLISEVENEEYAAFYPVERWLILYWTQEYQDLLADIISADSTVIATFLAKRKPQYDMLFETLQKKSRDAQFQLESSVRMAELNPQEKEFLMLYLKYLLRDENHPETTQDTLNGIAEDFLIKYPDSRYAYVIRTQIRVKYVPAKWSVAFELFTGYGIFTENLARTYENNIPIGAAVDINFKKFSLYLRNYIGRSRTKIDIPYDTGLWKKGSEVEVLLAEASLGYLIFENEIFKISPFAGISTTNIGPIRHDLDQDPSLEKVELTFTTTYTIGLNADLKLGQSGEDALLIQKTKQRYWLVRLRYAYNMPQFQRDYENYTGNMHYLTVGIGRFFRKIRRA